MLVSFDINFIRRDQKQRRNGAASLAIPTLFLVLPDKDTNVVFYLSCIVNGFKWRKDSETNKKQAQICLNKFAGVEHALRRKSMTSFNKPKRCYHGQCQYWPLLFRDRF